MSRAARLVATVGGIGRLRPAPGTWASAAAILAALGLYAAGGFLLLAAATVAVAALGFWACERDLPTREDQDPDEIVVDEIAGQWLACCFPAAAFFARDVPEPALMPWPAWVAAFVLFRLFDVRKPWLAGRADRAGGVRGVMMDDLWAGVFAGVATIVLGVAYHLWLFA